MSKLLDRFGKLPRSQRALLAGAVYVMLAAVLYFALVAPTLDRTSTAQRQQTELRAKRDQVRARAENRAAFEAELEQLAAELKQALTELPNDREIPGLLSEIDGLARKAGLDVSKFQPLPEVKQEYYAEVPVQVAMTGSFHEVTLFFDRVGKMSRIVSVEDIELGSPKDEGSEVSLTINGKVVTYRFLTEEEMKANKDPGKKKKGGKG